MNEPPLHERLLRRAEMLIELGYGGCDAELREAAAALRPPEGEVGEVIRDAEQYVERLDANEYYSNSPPVVISPKFVRAALAHLRRIAPAPAAEKPEPLVIEQSRESLTVGPRAGMSFETGLARPSPCVCRMRGTARAPGCPPRRS
jgi:hypothetical protein